jgi:hypothetical protein
MKIIPEIGKKYKLYDFTIKVNKINVYENTKNVYTDESSENVDKNYWISENNNTWYNWQDGASFIEIEQ